MIDRANRVRERAEATLFGRAKLQDRLQKALQQANARVLLHAFGGVGKTALAAEIAYDWLKNDRGTVLWLKIGDASPESAFEALAAAFNQSQAMAARQGADKDDLLFELLEGTIGLVILDDVWNGASLKAIQKAMPDDIPLLATSRNRYAVSQIIPLPDLPADEAINLLRRLAPNLVKDEEAAQALCEKLSYHAFALEVAGRMMQVNTFTAKKLLDDIEKTDITQLTVPLDYQEAGRENIAALIETTLNELPESAKNVFEAWGAFWSPQITPELIMQFFVGTPNVSDEMIANARENVPDIDKLSDDKIRVLLKQAIGQQAIDSQPAEEALKLLLQYGLATRINATKTDEGRPLMSDYYRLHDLGFEYAKAQNGDKARNRAVDVCLSYIKRYKEASLENFAKLDPEIDNFMGAATFAVAQERFADAEEFAWDLYANETPQILAYRGYYSLAINLLQQAADAAVQINNKQGQGAHLGNLGNAYFSLGEYPKAIDYHQQALAISRDIGDKRAEGQDLGNLGNAYSSLGEYDKAIDYYQQVLEISLEMGDKQSEGNTLGNLGNAYADLGEYQKAIDYFQQILIIHREIGDKRGEGNDLGNLGNAYRNLGEYDKAIEYHQQALAISREIGTKSAVGSILGNLGIAYKDLGDYTKAVDYFEQALTIQQEIGDKRGQGNQLGNLGNAYFSLGEYAKAIDYHQQALAIRREIGDRLGESNDLNNLGTAYEKLDNYEQAIAYFEAALALYRALGVNHHAATAERNLEIVRRKQARAASGDA